MYPRALTLLVLAVLVSRNDRRLPFETLAV
jgi:hypothetical protein